MPVPITELLKRADAGYSVKPYLCKTEQGRKVYVKPFGTLPSSLIHEWIGGRLAQCLKLPVADIDLVVVPQALVDCNTRSDWSSFRAGIGFGSYTGEPCFRDFRSEDTLHLNAAQLAQVYLFDYWIRNEDRQIGPTAGNPNTIVYSHGKDFYLIDHDNAFDENFDIGSFDKLHIGRNQKEYWLSKAHRDAWVMKINNCLEKLADFWDELPEEWLHSDLDIGPDSSDEIVRIRDILEKPITEPKSFWAPILR